MLRPHMMLMKKKKGGGMKNGVFTKLISYNNEQGVMPYNHSLIRSEVEIPHSGREQKQREAENSREKKTVGL